MRSAGGGSRIIPVVPLGLVVGTVFLYFIAGTDSGVDSTWIRLLSVAVVAGVFGVWAWVAFRDPRWRPTSVLWPAIVVVLLAIALSTLASANTRISQDYLAYAVILAGLYLLLRLVLGDERLRPWIPGTIVVLTYILVVAYLLVVLGRWISWWLLVGAPALPPLNPAGEALGLGDSGVVAAVAVLGFAIAAAHLGTGTRRVRIVVRVLAGLVTAVVVVSGSLAAWLAVLVTVVVLSLTAGGRGRTAAPVTRRLGRRGLRRIAALAAIAVMSFAVLAGPAMLARYIEDGKAAERVSLTVVSGRMVVGHLLTGVGPGMWAAERIPNTVPPEVDVYVADPGNGYLQAAAELGIVGLLAGLFGLACVAVLVRSALADESAARRRWGSAGLAVTVYTAAHLLLGNLIASPVALFLLAVPIAWIDASETRPLFVLPERFEERLADDGELVRTVLLGAGLALVGVAIAWAVLTERSALDMDRARTAADANDWAGALRPLASATSTDPDNRASLLPLGLAWARTGDAGKALASFARLSEAEDLPVAWMNRAWLEAAAGDAIAARRSLNRALVLGARQPQLALTAGLIHEQLGDLPESTSWYIETLVQEPRLAGSGFFQSSERVARWDTIRAGALERLAPGDAAEFWVSAGDLGQATAVVDTMPPGEKRALLELVIAAWGDEPGARDALAQYTRDHPADLAAVGWSARVAAHAGDDEAARGYREWASIVGAGEPVEDTDVIVELPPISVAPKSGLTSLAWGPETYRRHTPTAQMLADIPQLALAP